MAAPDDLRKLEKKVFRTTFEDGLLDIDMGLLIASFSLLAFLPEEDTSRWIRYGLFLGGMTLATLIYQLGKKFITEPRMGQVTFGPQRKRRKSTLAVILAVIVGLQALIVLFSILLWNNPGLADRLGLASLAQNNEKLLVSVLGALFVGPPLALVAYFNDFLRGYYHALLMSLAVFLLIWVDAAIPMLIAGALIGIPGVVLFIRFLRKYPKPPREADHGG